jgi:hypothetical protein
MRPLRSGILVGVGLVAGSWFGTPSTGVTVTVPETVVVEVRPAPEPTPIVDRLVDWEQVDRDSDCLWDFLQQHRIEITLANVITAGDWTDMHGGACAMMERENGE